MLYKDAANRKSNQQNLGTIRCSNLCTEIMEYTSPDEVAVCNLASVALPKFIVGPDAAPAAAAPAAAAPPPAAGASPAHGPWSSPRAAGVGYDLDALRATTRVVARSLDRVIDVTHYPLEEASRSNMRHRPIGIGVQGLADTFARLRLPFESAESAELNRLIFEAMYAPRGDSPLAPRGDSQPMLAPRGSRLTRAGVHAAGTSVRSRRHATSPRASGPVTLRTQAARPPRACCSSTCGASRRATGGTGRRCAPASRGTGCATLS